MRPLLRAPCLLVERAEPARCACWLTGSPLVRNPLPVPQHSQHPGGWLGAAGAPARPRQAAAAGGCAGAGSARARHLVWCAAAPCTPCCVRAAAVLAGWDRGWRAPASTCDLPVTASPPPPARPGAAADPAAEARGVADAIAALVGGGVDPRDIAVLFRFFHKGGKTYSALRVRGPAWPGLARPGPARLGPARPCPWLLGQAHVSARGPPAGRAGPGRCGQRPDQLPVGALRPGSRRLLGSH